MSRTSVQFGAGNIGRGFLGQLYFESGYATTFVDVVAPLIDALNARGEYPLRIVDEQSTTLRIESVSGLLAGDIEAVADRLAAADLASTAVGVAVLPKVAPLIAAGIAKRFENPHAAPLDFIVCENLINAGPYLREEVRRALDGRFHDALDTKVGFVEASIGRMVPAMTDSIRAEDPLLVCVEAYCELPVDANGFKGSIPDLKNLRARRNFAAYVERKLFVHNAGHAATAYLGHLRGHEYIWQAVEDEVVRAKVEAAFMETHAGLSAKWGLDPDELKAHSDDLLRRFHNKALGDQVARVAKDPIRKLGPNDRLIGAGRMCLANGVLPVNIALAAAAAISYDDPTDRSSQAVQEKLRRTGIDGVFREVCGIDPQSELARLIKEGFQQLHKEGWIGQPNVRD